MMRANVSNKDVGAKLGLDYTTISRYRSGERRPSLDVMLKIAEVYNWTLDLQALSRRLSVWHEGFEAALATEHGEVSDDEAGTEAAPA